MLTVDTVKEHGDAFVERLKAAVADNDEVLSAGVFVLVVIARAHGGIGRGALEALVGTAWDAFEGTAI